MALPKRLLPCANGTTNDPPETKKGTGVFFRDAMAVGTEQTPASQLLSP
jgi:hypothetical protein